MTLPLTFVVLAVAASVVLLGLGVFLQGYWYNALADRLWLRAAVGGVAVASFLTLWVYVNTRADRDNKYGALHEFKPTSETPVAKFQAVRRGRSKAETTVAFSRPPGEKEFKADADKAPFRWNTSDYITVAVLVPEEAGKPPARFDAALKDDLTYDPALDKKTFREAGGSRFIEEDAPGVVLAPSGGVVFAAVLLNLLHAAVWFAAFWLALRFTWGHALGLAVAVSTPLTLLAVPLLFALNHVPRPG